MKKYVLIAAALAVFLCSASADAALRGVSTPALVPTATVATTVTVEDTTDATSFCAFLESATGDLGIKTDLGCTYNAATGMMTLTGITSALTGNASTATALAANGANCSAGSYPLGVDASGAVESCTASYTDENVDDRVDALITDGNGITTSYNDGANTLTVTVDGAHCYSLYPTTPDGDVVAGTDLYRTVIRDAATVVGVFAYVDTAGTTDAVTIDINEAGTTILSTKLTIDAGENDSTTAAAAAVISDTALADNAVLNVDVDDQDGGNTAAGLEVQVCVTY